MKKNNFKKFLNKNVHITQWIKLLLLSISIVIIGLVISFIDHNTNYPTDEEISMYNDISYCIWEEGLKAGNFNNMTIENYSLTSNDNLFSNGLENADLNNINMNLEFNTFTIENNFSKGFLIKPKGITNIHVNVYPSAGITYIYSDFNFIKAKMPMILSIFSTLVFVIAIYTLIEYSHFNKKFN